VVFFLVEDFLVVVVDFFFEASSFLVVADFLVAAVSLLDVLVVIVSFLLAHDVIKPTAARTAMDVIRDFFIRCD
jgi:hypothetical protein